MTRLEALKDRCSRLPYEKLAKRLSEAEFDQLVQFIEDHDDLGHLEFEYQVNRMHLDQDKKSKNWAIIQELLVVCNTAAKGLNRQSRFAGKTFKEVKEVTKMGAYCEYCENQEGLEEYEDMDGNIIYRCPDCREEEE